MTFTVYLMGVLTLAGLLASGCAKRPAMSGMAVPPPVAAAAPAEACGYGLRAAKVEFLAPASVAARGLPTDATPGECYIQSVIPAQVEAVKERVLKRAASSKIEIVPEQWQDVEERVLVKPASKRIEVVPATFEEVEERVMVRPASKRIEVVPASYKDETERVLVRAAYTVWKRSSELTPAEREKQRIDPNAGDILCLVEVPAEYSTVTRQVVDVPASTREVEIPAEWSTVKKTVVKTPATTREV